MKISIAWAFDHIDADVRQVDVQALVTKFNQITAEIEGTRKVSVSLDALACAQVTAATAKGMTVSVPEWRTDVTLPSRTDIRERDWCLIRRDGKSYVWATSVDLGGEKEMILPAISLDASAQKGAWKKDFESADHIVTVDNKSITHRPDMWGHRGFAREIAAILDLPLKPLEQFLSEKRVLPHENKFAGDANFPVNMLVEDQQGCKRFAGLYFSAITSAPSSLWMLSRLSRVDARAINMIVDITNYVMFDTSQPLHAFDADKLPNKSIIVRRARNKERLALLDGQSIELTASDMVIADATRPIALAGIMGGKDTGVTASTNAIFLESANFDATTIRRSAQHHKLRSEASARFEKSLSPNQNTEGIARFLKLLNDTGVSYKSSDSIISLGKLEQPPVLEVSHRFIESRLGVSISPTYVIKTLEKLAFTVKSFAKDGQEHYRITVPLFRATKDIAIKEDIVEEVGRFYGYSTIPLTLPQRETKPSDIHGVTQVSRIKHLLAYGLSMRELSSYSFLDESFIRSLNWDPGQTLQVKNPVSENWHRLATTLMPAMFRAVRDNSDSHDQLRFFEWARVWNNVPETSEQKVLTGIFFDKKKAMTFYDAKALLHQLFISLHVPVYYRRADRMMYPWLDADQTAYISYDGRSIGVFGRVSEPFWRSVTEGVAYVFELDGDFLEQYRAVVKLGKALPKYPGIERDVSMMVPLGITVDEVAAVITRIDQRIVDVGLRDFFQKKEWKDQKSLTFRYLLRDPNKTLTKDDAERVHTHVVKALEALGATIR